MNEDIRTRNDFAPDDLSTPSVQPSLPPESKVTLQLALCIMLGVVVLVAFVGAVLGVVDKAALSNILSAVGGGLLGLLTGGNRLAR